MLFIILALICVIQTSHSQMGTFFIFDNVIYPSYSSWVVTYTVNFTPYRKAVQNATENVNELSSLISLFGEHNFVSNNIMPNETNSFRYNLVKMLEKEISTARQEVDRIQMILNDITQVATLRSPSRPTRALIPVIGEVLSSLFGLSTHQQLKRAKSAISDLQDNHNQLVNVVSESITLLNKSNYEIQSNRHAVNTLSTAIKNLKQEYSSQYMQLHHQVYSSWETTRSVTVLQSSFHVIEAKLRDIYQEVLTLRRNLELAFKGQLTVDLIPPNKLLSLLTNIQNSVPSYVKLPYPLNREHLIKYYQLIQPTVMPDHYKSHVIFALPLVHTNSSYEVYHTIQVPFPNDDGLLGAYYQLEDKYLVISPLKDYYALLTIDEYNTCKHSPVCKFSSPIYSLSQNPTCISSLFIRDFLLIDKFCSKNIVTFPKIPIVRHMFARHYIVATSKELQLDTLCPNSPSTSETITTVEHIVVPDMCSLTCDYFTIPPSYSGNSNEEQEVRVKNDVNLGKLVNSIWLSQTLVPFKNTSTIKSYNLTELEDVRDMPVSHLYRMLDQSESTHKKGVIVRHTYRFNNTHMLFVLAALLILLCFCLLYLCRRRRRRTPIKSIVRKRVHFVEADNDSPECEIIDTEPYTSNTVNRSDIVRADSSLAKGLVQNA